MRDLDGNPNLCRAAVLRGRADILDHCLTAVPEHIRLCDEDGEPLLSIALNWLACDTVAVFRRHGADIGVFGAALLDDLEEVQAALSQSCMNLECRYERWHDVSEEEQEEEGGGKGLIHYAAKASSNSVLSWLLDQGCLLQHATAATDPSPLQIAIEAGRTEHVIQLLEYVGNSIRPAVVLPSAALAGSVEIMNALLTCCEVHGFVSPCDVVDWFGFTPLHHAVRENNMSMLTFLLEHGANPNVQDRDGRTPLFWSTGKSAIAAKLIEHGAEIDMYSAAGLGMIDWLREHLRDDPTLIETKTGNDETPLHEACAAGQLGAAEFLLQSGTPINVMDAGGGTPIHWAARFGQVDAISFLAQRGAHVNSCGNAGDAPIHRAAVAGHTTAVLRLLALGADPNLPDSEGEHPLRVAADHNQAEVVRLLLEHGADHRYRNQNGTSALDAAIYAAAYESALILREAGE